MNNGFAVIQLLSRREADNSKFYKERPALQRQYEGRLRQTVMQEWYMHSYRNSGVKDAEIGTYLEKLYSPPPEGAEGAEGAGTDAGVCFLRRRR